MEGPPSAESGHGFKLVRVIPDPLIFNLQQRCFFLAITDHSDKNKNKTIPLSHETYLNMLQSPDRKTSKVEIFSSDVGEWKDIIVPHITNYTFTPVSYNGMLLWFSLSSPVLRILGFEINPNCGNAAANRYTQFSLPQGYTNRLLLHGLGVCKGCLRLAQLVHFDSNHGLKLLVWELDKLSQCWELVNELDFCEFTDSKDASKARLCYQNEKGGINTGVLAHNPLDEDILYLIFRRKDEKLESYIFSCNIRKKTLGVIHELSDLKCEAFPLLIPYG